MAIRTILVSLFVKIALAQTKDFIVVDIQQGPVRGYRDADRGLYSFLNIPYATAPTGIHKFKAPLPPPQWIEPYDVTHKIITCIQPIAESDIETLNLLVQEDCLVANIFVPETSASNLPVLVTIHGGAYQNGGNYRNLYRGLVSSQKVIVVSFNYRLGVHGFLCLGTENVPGNAGMKDQIALLRWVQKNIGSFGGNPADVTIHGCSAGGGSVDFLTLSPMATGLFTKVITESGAFLGSLGPQVDPVRNAQKYAHHLNFSNIYDLTALDNFYTTASNELLISKADFIRDRTDTLILMTPCVERDTAEDAFLSDIPINIIKTGKYNRVPILTGFAEMEGLILINKFDDYMIKMNEKFSDFLPAELQFANESQKEQVAEKVKEFYFGNKAVSVETVLSYVNYLSDMMFGYPMLRATHLRREAMNDTIFFYKYTFYDENTALVPHTTVRGAQHCAQRQIVMDDRTSSNHTEEFIQMRENLRKLWINFITTGNPTPEESSLPTWPAVGRVISPFMVLDQPMVLEQSPMLEESVRLWDAIYEEHYRPPIPPTFPKLETDSAFSSTVSFILIITSLLLSLNYTV